MQIIQNKESALVLSNDLTWVEKESNNIKVFKKGKASTFLKSMNNSYQLKIVNTGSAYIRFEKISIEEFEDLMKRKKEINIDYKGIKLSVLSTRYENFILNGYTCNHCGLKGEYLYIERHPHTTIKWHMNLYGVRNNVEIMLTKDHLIPLSNSGKNTIGNYQVLCRPCNEKKGNKFLINF